MDDTLRLIQHLYGENVDDASFSDRLDDDERLRREHDRLRAVKEALDRRPSPSPDPEVVDRIVDRAGQAAPSSANGQAGGPAADRAARPPTRSRKRRLQGAGALLVLLLIAGLGWWSLPGEGPGLDRAESPATAQSAASSPSQEADAVPDWDDREDVVRLHRRIESLQARSRSDTWDTTVQPATTP